MPEKGYNGSQLWDTAFAMQALIESGLNDMIRDTIRSGYRYLTTTQVIVILVLCDCFVVSHRTVSFAPKVLEDTPNLKKYFRHISKGAWPFSTVDHGWPISDCTSEGVKALILAHRLGFVSKGEQTITDQRLFDAKRYSRTKIRTAGGPPMRTLG